MSKGPRDVLVSAWVWLVILTSTLVYGSLAILTSWIPPRGRLFLFWAKGWSRTMLSLARIPYAIEVPDAAAAVPQAVFMSNHESLVDIPLLFLGVRQDVRFLAKRSLFFVPFLGWSMWLAGFVPVDRKAGGKAVAVLETLERRTGAGRSILVFPEGTRSRTGEVQPFRKSGFLLALRTGLPIVPVAVRGARAVVGADSFWIAPQPVRLRMGEPIPTEGLSASDVAPLVRRVREEILQLRG